MLPRIDVPVYELDLPLSKKHIRFRPFLVKEQRNLLIAMESDDKEEIKQNIKQVLNNCTVTDGIVIDDLPLLDIELYFINLRARSVGEIVEDKYKCENLVDDKPCGNLMDVKFNLLDIKPEGTLPDNNVKLTDKISVQMEYPKFSLISRATKFDKQTDMAFDIIVNSIVSIWDGEQFYYASEAEPGEMVDFLESLNQDQFQKLQTFFENLPTLTKKIEVDCSKCGFHHTIEVEGLENFFG